MKFKKSHLFIKEMLELDMKLIPFEKLFSHFIINVLLEDFILLITKDQIFYIMQLRILIVTLSAEISGCKYLKIIIWLPMIWKEEFLNIIFTKWNLGSRLEKILTSKSICKEETTIKLLQLKIKIIWDSHIFMILIFHKK